MLLGAWVSVVTVVLLVVPGACVGRRMTLSWPVAIAAGAPITFAIVSVSTVLYGAIGFEWNLITALVAVLIAFALCLRLVSGCSQSWWMVHRLRL
ncbi:DUF6541 family protein [Gordonia aichiensis]